MGSEPQLWGVPCQGTQQAASMRARVPERGPVPPWPHTALTWHTPNPRLRFGFKSIQFYLPRWERYECRFMQVGTCEARDGRTRAHMDVLVACPGNTFRMFCAARYSQILLISDSKKKGKSTALSLDVLHVASEPLGGNPPKRWGGLRPVRPSLAPQPR